jgi:hypothetical protein
MRRMKKGGVFESFSSASSKGWQFIRYPCDLLKAKLNKK